MVLYSDGCLIIPSASNQNFPRSWGLITEHPVKKELLKKYNNLNGFQTDLYMYIYVCVCVCVCVCACVCVCVCVWVIGQQSFI